MMKSLERTSLADSAAEAIRQEILAGRWALRDKLPNEATLCESLAVSRGTLREAVRMLVSEGYLETRQGSGTYVRSATDAARPLTMARRATLRDQFEARLALDAEAARLAALRAGPEVIADLRRLLAERGNFDGTRKDAFVARDLAFHRAVVAASGNAVLLGMYDFFSELIGETIASTLGGELREPDMAAHAAVIDGIESGDPDLAEAAVRRFMAPVLRDLERLLGS